MTLWVIEIIDAKSNSIPGDDLMVIRFKYASKAERNLYPKAEFKTYVDPDFKNYENWKDVELGDVLSDLELKLGSNKIIDADCKPVFIRNEPLQKQRQGSLF